MRKKTYDRYLASISCFAIDYEKGSSFVEVTDAERDLVGFMQARNRSYKCTVCGTEMIANDNNDHTGEKCPQCQGKLVRANPVDIEANMKRIRKAIEYNKVAV
jgi:DNA-directed RNA polymerase subunit RPC12/RpoP